MKCDITVIMPLVEADAVLAQLNRDHEAGCAPLSMKTAADA